MKELLDAIPGGTTFYTEREIRCMSPLILAYIGDSVFETYIRAYVIAKGIHSIHLLHKASIRFVKAGAQASAVHEIMSILSEEEQNVVRRGRNAHPHTVPKNANVGDYRYATGLESLIGFLYLIDRRDRLNELMGIVLKILDTEKTDD